MTEFRRVALNSGITLNIAFAGDSSSPAVILLHGFPESHRTWRELVPRLQDRFYLIMPDQRGFGGSDRPRETSAYTAEKPTADVFALADHLGLDRFALVGHDWGGAIAWGAAQRGDPRLERLAIINAPHPVIFQKSLIESAAQRAASQYINALRLPGVDKHIARRGYDWLFDRIFSPENVRVAVPAAERQQYLAEWSQPGALRAMINWYRATPLMVPPPFLTVPVPTWVLNAFPKVHIPTLVVWGMDDKALLPIQLEGLDRLVEDLTIIRIEDAGHFAPWEAPDAVAGALGPFLAGDAPASAASR